VRPMTKGGVMIGKTERARRSGLARKIGAGRDQGEGQTDDRRARAHEDARKQRVPATPQRSGPPRQSSPRWIDSRAWRGRMPGATGPHSSRTALESTVRTGQKTKTTTQPDDEADRAGQEGVALHEAACGEAVHTGARGTRGRRRNAPAPKPVWLGPVEPKSPPATPPTTRDGDGQPLEGASMARPPPRRAAGGRGDARILARVTPREERQEERDRRSGAATGRRYAGPGQSRRRGGVRGSGGASPGSSQRRPAARTTAGRRRPSQASPASPRGAGHAGRAGRIEAVGAPAASRTGRATGARRPHFGSAFTSVSHFWSRRFRSADEPYLAKS
jgi:hypothetical protein